MDLGAFSVSLAVRDLDASKAFYEKLGFEVFMGQRDENWLIMKNGSRIIGLFQGMFERNTLTFNPGWDQDAEQLAQFTDVRDIQAKLKALGIEILAEVGESSTGPGNLLVMDPDGNPILIDQHV